MGIGQQALGFERRMDVFESVAIDDGCRRGLPMRDQMRSAFVARLGQMLADPDCGLLLGVVHLWIIR